MWRGRAPATSRVPITMAANTSMVPRSGCSWMSPMGTPATAQRAEQAAAVEVAPVGRIGGERRSGPPWPAPRAGAGRPELEPALGPGWPRAATGRRSRAARRRRPRGEVAGEPVVDGGDEGHHADPEKTNTPGGGGSSWSAPDGVGSPGWRCSTMSTPEAGDGDAAPSSRRSTWRQGAAGSRRGAPAAAEAAVAISRPPGRAGRSARAGLSPASCRRCGGPPGPRPPRRSPTPPSPRPPTYCGSAAGAKADEQGGVLLAVAWAVPVLPATGTASSGKPPKAPGPCPGVVRRRRRSPARMGRRGGGQVDWAGDPGRSRRTSVAVPASAPAGDVGWYGCRRWRRWRRRWPAAAG